MFDLTPREMVTLDEALRLDIELSNVTGYEFMPAVCNAAKIPMWRPKKMTVRQHLVAQGLLK